MKKNTHLVVIAVVLGILIFFSPIILYISYNSIINGKVNLVSVPYVKHTIQPGTIINDNMISTMNIPKSALEGDYITNRNDIIGMCVKENTIIVKGSPVYSDLIEKCN